ncbi:HlyD family efflux transporter periplasmic adaptor subunit [Corynebacterium hindlerae]|uniref:HlyD family efflux transporter periplasmic adaptor subunit n=1 Tax=Corynebacterium hindlerae TaxID=699041 RepID=UPI0031B682CA
MKIQKRTAAITAASLLGIAAIGGGSYAFLSPKERTPVIMASDVREIQEQDVVEKVHAEGGLEATRTTSITSTLTGPVKDLQVKLGDRVADDQLLAVMDTTAIERQLEAERANRASQDTANNNQLLTAQQQYQQLHEKYDHGLNPEMNAAAAAERQAASALETAQRAFENKKKDTKAGTDPTLIEQQKALAAARDEQRDAALNLLRVNAGTIFNVITTEAGSPDMMADSVQTQDRLNRADRDLAVKEKDYQQTLVAIDRELATLAAQVRDASAAHREAVVGVESARLAALHQIDAQRAAVEQAQAAVNSGSLASEVTQRHLTIDVAKAEVHSPHGGIITELNAKVGAPSEGVLMTVADDSALKITTLVKESEIGKVKPGDEVTFTTAVTKDKKFTGNVINVASAAKTNPDGASKKVEFPVEIAVKGNTEGLRIGSTSKLEIVVNKQKGALSVPREAVLKDGGNHAVIALIEDNGKYIVKKIPVQVKAQTDFDAAIASPELSPGTKIASDPSKYIEDVDKRVRVEH